MKDIILFWIQWSGKWTQAKKIIENHPDSYSYFSSWDLFRAITSWWENAIWNYVKSRIENGLLINDGVTNSLFQAYFYTVLDDKKHMLLDGYPRTINQLDDIFRLMEQEKRDALGIHFTLTDDVATQRMLSRWRKDDSAEAIKFRLEQFYEKTMPVIKYFAQHADLVNIDASQSIDEVASEVEKAIEN